MRDALLNHNANYGKWFATPVLRAINRYSMVEKGATLTVALSGGKDSAVLLFVLAYLMRHSALAYRLLAVHARTGDYDCTPLEQLCEAVQVPLQVVAVDLQQAVPRHSVCSLCARLKRGAMVNWLEEQGLDRLAFGHHADDAAATLLLNLVHRRRLESFAPRVGIAGSKVLLVRPLIYLEERTILRIQRHLQLPLLTHACSFRENGARETVCRALDGLAERMGVPDLGLRVVQALEKGFRDPWDRL